MKSHDYPLSLIRLLSLCSIVLCHILSYYGNELSYWFNVGTQVFLCISGYLYGQKEIKDCKSFYIRRFKKILTPFYIVLIPALILNLLAGKIDVFTALRSLLMNATVEGGGHLWFVPTILFCYVITPILYSFFNGSKRRSFIAVTVLGIQIITLFCLGFASFYPGPWISCYLIGYAIGYNEKELLYKRKHILICFALLAAMNILQIYIDYGLHMQLTGIVGKIYVYWKNFNHVWLGIFLFCSLKWLFERIPFNTNLEKVLDVTDYYSYETYLVHQFIILGPFSLLGVSPFLVANLVIVFASIFILAWVAKKAEKIIQHFSPNMVVS